MRTSHLATSMTIREKMSTCGPKAGSTEKTTRVSDDAHMIRMATPSDACARCTTVSWSLRWP